MKPASNPDSNARHFRNWLSMAGAVMGIASFFAFLFLFALDLFAHNGNPYLGILAYVIAPSFLFLGLGMMAAGFWWQRRRARAKGELAEPNLLTVDLSRPADRRKLRYFVVGSLVFLLCTAIGSYQTYHVSESVQFCGQACHTPMKPEFTAYKNSPHARVACVECHVGHGAEAFVKAKMNGMHQLMGVMTGEYERPIKTPIRNLRPARETCEQCHWPNKFSGNIDRTYQRYLADETNTPFAVRLSLKVGGADPAHGTPGGIHWHVSQDNKIEYVATDDRRQTIPWVRVTDPQGTVTEYRMPGFTNNISTMEVRLMDCIDCHNRPSHRYRSPNDAIDLALSIGKIDPKLPWVKSNSIAVLAAKYSSETEALEKIASTLRAKYPAHPQAEKLVAEVQNIYSQNFFPDMKADWRAYPENIGHKDWPGCFRCHDGKHASTDGKKKIPASDCVSCHTILAQGVGEELNLISPNGQKFKHPGDEVDGACNDCHTGGP
ncbi:MAG: NapC/NirT family cytochrome c [Akkermansiaceae bacterium]|nr:NapC/NirT family cytochrome c [Verrucomicrobiales bacterium]